MGGRGKIFIKQHEARRDKSLPEEVGMSFGVASFTPEQGVRVVNISKWRSFSYAFKRGKEGSGRRIAETIGSARAQRLLWVPVKSKWTWTTGQGWG